MHDMKWLIRRFLERGAVLVAADEDEPGAIWGWSATTANTVLYTYVRHEFRQQGVGSLLLAPFLKRRDITYCARPQIRDVPIPPGWRYSFLAGLRLLERGP